MSASRRMYGSFVLFGVTFFVFDSGLVNRTWPRGLVWAAGIASLLFFLYAMYVFYFDVTRGDRHLQKSGVKGTAVVVSAKQTHTLAQTGQFAFEAPYIWKYVLRVSLPGKAPYEATCSVARDDISAGSTVNVTASRFNRRSVAILSGRSAPARGDGRPAPDQDQDPASRMQLISNAVQSGQSRPAATPDSEMSHVDALAKLAELHSQGALSDAEFAAEKARILGQ
jgi:Short C-terminal domain